MKTDWQTKKLGEVCDIGAGNSAPQKKEFFVDGVYPFFRTSDVGQIHIGSITKASDYLNEKGIKGLKLFNKGTILLSKSGASTFLNHRVILGIDGYVSSHLATVKTDENVLSSNYLFYFLQEVKAQDLIQDHKYPSLNLPVIGNIEISYPESLPEQHRIVKILDEVFADVAKAKANAEKNLRNAKEIFESYLQDIFVNPGKDWEGKRLGDIVRTTQGVQIPKNLHFKQPKLGYKRYLYISDFDHENNLKYIEDKYPSKLVTKNDLIVVNTGASAGKIFRGIDGILSNNLFKVSFSDEILNTDFLFYFVTSNIFKKFQAKIVRGTANPHMGHENFNATPINLPSLNIQKSIVAKLDALSAETKKLEAIYRQKLADLEELKKSVLKKAFNGEL